MAPHRDPSVTEKNFGSKGFCCMEQLMHVVKFGVPVDVGEGGDFSAALSYAKYSSSDRHQKRLVEKLVEDIWLMAVFSLYTKRKHKTFIVQELHRRNKTEIESDLGLVVWRWMEQK